MTELKQRIQIVMQETGWDATTLARIAGVSQSAVSQWLGNGSKLIKSIRNIEAASRIAFASGFSARWIATGNGPRTPPTPGVLEVNAPKTSAAQSWPFTTPRNRFDRLSTADKARIDDYIALITRNAESASHEPAVGNGTS